ncbi:cyclin-dependent kinase inhibitor 1C-like [Anopheles marshallii]|uniref:cyclin-dependent kinase inhibitor 1C-like n=1 Tax=Anopheles marshallii TaxID=1521116 RepID=UPI00237A9FDC|nr:cyclin-dependent kinase inhibitor 1C-like [Anopheles marshallii]
MFAKLSIVAVCSLLAVASAKPHVLTPVGPAVVTAQSSQVFARTYNGFVPFAVPAPVPAPAFHYHTPAFVLPAPPPAPVFYPHPVVYNPPVPVPVPVPAAPAAVLPTVVAAAPAAKLVAAAPVAKVAKLVRPGPFHATFRYRSVVA